MSPTPVLCILLRTGDGQETDTQTQTETGVAVTAKVNKGLEATEAGKEAARGGRAKATLLSIKAPL